MGSNSVVVYTPSVQLLPRVVKVHEPVRVQAFASKAAVEALDERVVCGLAGAREVQNDVVAVGPQVHIAAYELTAVVHTNGLRYPTSRHTFSWVRTTSSPL